MIEGIKANGKDWKKISQDQFLGQKSEVEIEMRACILFKVKDESEINEKQIQDLEKKFKVAHENQEAINGHQTKTTNGRHAKK